MWIFFQRHHVLWQFFNLNCYDWNLLHLPKDLFKVWCLEVILWNNTWMNDDDVLKCYSQMLARLPSYVMPTHAANSKIGWEVYVLWENTNFFCPNKLYLYAVFFLSGSETGCKGNGDVLHATSLHLEFRTCWLGAMKIKAGSVEPAGWSCNCCNTRGAVKALTGKSKKLQFCCTSVVEVVCHE